MSEEEKTKKLNIFRYAMFVTFVLVFVIATIIPGVIAGGQFSVFAQPSYWLSIAVGGAICAAGYYGYKSWLTKK